MVAINKVLKVSFLKTLRFNIHYFGWQKAWLFPVIVCRDFSLKSLKGTVHLHSYRTGMVILGGNNEGIMDSRHSRGSWHLAEGGVVEFWGKCSIHSGCIIQCGPNGHLVIGDYSSINVMTKVLCSNLIEIGSNVSISWECLLMDNDWHKIIIDGVRKNNVGEIKIGNHCWICAKSTVLKGANIGNDCVVAASSLITKAFPDNHLVGSTNRIICSNVNWIE